MVGTGSAGGRPLAYVLDDEAAVATMICKQLTMLGMEAWQYTDPGSFFKALQSLATEPGGAGSGARSIGRRRGNSKAGYAQIRRKSSTHQRS